MASSDTLKSVRFSDDIETTGCVDGSEKGNSLRFLRNMRGRRKVDPWSINEKDTRPKASREKTLSSVFSEEYDVEDQRRIFDPRGPVIDRWNKIFLVACLVSLFIDPLFFYLPRASRAACIRISVHLEVVLTVIRMVVDVFYMIQVFVRFRTAYVAPSSRVFGRGELIIDHSKIAARYLRTSFWFELVACLPLPQCLIWLAIPRSPGSLVVTTKNAIRFVILLQYLLRLYLLFPLSSQIVKTSGVLTETAWAGAAYNLMLYILASHVLGSSWYLLSIERQAECWRQVCDQGKPNCQYSYLDCHNRRNPVREAWFVSSNVSDKCDPKGDFFEFGIYADAVTFRITDEGGFLNKYFYCLWWGLRNLSSLGQNLLTSTFIGEIMFAIIIAILGLVLFGLLIGNVQTFLQSTTMRLEEWRIRRTDTEEWMKHRQLPLELRQSVRSYDHYRWIATRGVDEESILKCLPIDLRRDIKRHLCLNLVRQVPLFDRMDERMLDAICERLRPVLFTRGKIVVREGNPADEMLFILRGRLDSCTTNGGRMGFFNTSRIGPGEFCGEELLTWALEPRPSIMALPASTRTVEAVTEVEAFALVAEDLKFVASQFRKLHSKRLRQTLRFHSQQWRTWAACFIQAAWFRYKRRKEADELKWRESLSRVDPPLGNSTTLLRTGSGFVTYSSRLATKTLRRGGSHRRGSNADVFGWLQKPVEPDFSDEP